MKICAAIVTFNRRDLLRESLHGLKKQTRPLDEIIVFDNNSQDGTEEMIKSEFSDITYIKSKENLGGSGGFFNVIKQAYDRGHDWVYVLDDDAEPFPNALEELLKSPKLNKETAALASKKIDLQDNIQKNHAGQFNFKNFKLDPVNDDDFKKEVVQIEVSSFVGVLINREAIKKIGYPEPKLFIFYDDAEYCLRLNKYGPIYLVSQSVIRHKEEAAQPFTISFFGKKIIRTQLKNTWKDYYGFRNTFYIVEQHGSFLHYFLIFLRLIKTTLAILVFDSKKFFRIKLYWKAFFDGCFKKYGKGIDPVEFFSKLKPRILFLTMGRLEPASRYRVLQYLPLLKKNNYKYTVIPLNLSKKAFSSQKIFKPFFALGIILVKLFSILLVPFYDVVFMQRTVIRGLSPWVEKIIKLLNKNIIFDIDDAIWLQYQEKSNPVDSVMNLSSQVICGNKYIQNHAINYNENTEIIPTPVDTGKYKSFKKEFNNEIILGWIGSSVNLKYLEQLKDDLFIPLSKKYPQVKLQIISDQKLNKNLGIKTEFIPWSAVKDVEMINNFDIGLMPLEDNEWVKGKCSFKALQYMSCQVVPVVSAVGMNNEVIQDGENGFLIKENKEWLEKIIKLIEDKDLKLKLGIQARQTVIDKYSLEANFKNLDNLLKSFL